MPWTVLWMHIPCGCCNGLQWGGDTPQECLDCDGTGALWITENDRLAEYPGGLFTGYWPGKFQKMKDAGYRAGKTPEECWRCRKKG
jgi:hypothetical protein